MGFVDAVKSGFVNAFKFSGRSRRPEYWWFFLFVFAGAVVLGLLEVLLFGGGPAGRGFLVPLFQIIVFIPFLAVGWRRLQDTGRPGWWLLVPSAIVVLSSLVAGSMMAGLMRGGMMQGQMMTGDGEAMPMAGAAGSFGLLFVLWVAQIVAGILIIWWMTRPSQRGENTYGPEPRVR